MSPSELLPLIRRRPFIPFRIHLSDGVVYEIHHPEMVMIGVASATIGFPEREEVPIYTRTEIIALRHIVRLEPLQSAEVETAG